MMRFVVGVVLALATILGALALEGGDGLSLLGLSAFLMVWFVPFFASAAVWGYRSWSLAWRAAFRKVGADVARRSVELWKFNEFVFYLAGFLACLMGAILILDSGHFGPASVGVLGHSLASALVAPLYGFFFGYTARILRGRVELVNA